MNSRLPSTALRPNSPQQKAIQDLLDYIVDWQALAQTKGYHFITDTSDGLKLTLKATLEMLAFLVEECGFKYIMTARLNEDSLEQFFSMRGTCGSNDHPDSNLFIQMYGLISTFSLIKPPKESSVSGKEMLAVLLLSQGVR